METHSLSSPADDSILWSLLLITYASLILTNASSAAGLNATWLLRLTTSHPLPELEDGIEDAETYGFLDEHLGDFLRLEGQEKAEGPAEVLDSLGET
ncbi:hypothetical protein N0V94_009755, partial [Neodidymelliopsis sp. IMI 364377]